MSKANKNKPTHTGDNGGAPSGNPTPNPSTVPAGNKHPFPSTNKSPFAESSWTVGDQLLQLRGSMVSSIGDIFKLNRFMQTAKQRMNRLRKDITANRHQRELQEIDVRSLKTWRTKTDKDIADIVGSVPVSPIGTKNLTELTANMAEQHEINLAMQERIVKLEAWLTGIGFGAALILFIFMVKLVVDNYGYSF